MLHMPLILQASAQWLLRGASATVAWLTDRQLECLRSLNVVAGDVIVMGTDGLFDNCPVQEIVALLPDSDEAVPGSAERIASAARAHAGGLPTCSACATHHCPAP